MLLLRLMCRADVCWWLLLLLLLLLQRVKPLLGDLACLQQLPACSVTCQPDMAQ
jgi:hypothetical protein